MASLVEGKKKADGKKGNYLIMFRFGGRQYMKSLATTNEKEAINRVGTIEETLARIQNGFLPMATGADVWEFVKTGGVNASRPASAQVLTLGDLREWFLSQSPDRPSTGTTRIHLNHFCEVLGEKKNLASITGDDLQGYVNTRHEDDEIAPKTIGKELSTLSMCWNRAHLHGKSACGYPACQVRLPRAEAKEPFRTWAQLAKSGKPAPWENLYLRASEIEELLDWLEGQQRTWFFPAIVMAAHTGARRSEILRSRREDWDFDGSGTVSLRERRRSQSTDTNRPVELTPRLAKVMQDWFDRTPGQYAIRGKDGTLTVQAMVDEWEHVFKPTKWKVMKGYHVFRHSFISNLACAGVDQRIIDKLVGHQTDQQRERYRHLFPELTAGAIAKLFR